MSKMMHRHPTIRKKSYFYPIFELNTYEVEYPLFCDDSLKTSLRGKTPKNLEIFQGFFPETHPGQVFVKSVSRTKRKKN